MSRADEAVDDALVAALRAHGLIDAGESPRFFRVPGGVSANVWRVEVGERRFCVKQALGQLRVADDWYAPTSRCAAEAAWLRLAGTVGIGVPVVLAELPEFDVTVMSWIDAGAQQSWKQHLVVGDVDAAFASAVGNDIGAVHRATAGDVSVAAAFDNPAAFDALRVKPYFEHAISRNRAVETELREIMAHLRASRIALIHGDVTPKNILVDQQPVILDAEVATYADPAFDAALCSTHLLLKSTVCPGRLEEYLTAMTAFVDAWLKQVNWEPLDPLGNRLARLIGALLIARLDGKSPVEYLTDEHLRQAVRAVGQQLVANGEISLDGVAELWRDRVLNEGTEP